MAIKTLLPLSQFTILGDGVDDVCKINLREAPLFLDLPLDPTDVVVVSPIQGGIGGQSSIAATATLDGGVLRLSFTSPLDDWGGNPSNGYIAQVALAVPGK
ncbi:MAG: hypothetical protein H7X95_10995, partial [Deltaproteobacteria bacterium]|nr:hypothetical protein [Deltaproteobacteria bacterium]